MALIKTRGVSVDTVKLARDMKSIAEATRKVAQIALTESLQAMIDSIKSASSLRATEVQSANLTASSGTVDNPLAGAQVVTDKRRSSVGTRGARLIVYVDHDNGDGVNIFNLLDAGVKPRQVQTRFVFPKYTGHATPEGMASGDPADIRRSINSANIKLNRDAKGRPIMVSPKVGRNLKAVPKRGFYEAAAKYAKEQLLSQKIVSASGQYSYRLSEDQLVIKATDRNRFKKI